MTESKGDADAYSATAMTWVSDGVPLAVEKRALAWLCPPNNWRLLGECKELAARAQSDKTMSYNQLASLRSWALTEKGESAACGFQRLSLCVVSHVRALEASKA